MLFGCRARPVQHIEYIQPANVTAGQALQAADQVLGQMYFKVQTIDHHQGFVRTRPLPAGQLFEFWRKDNIGPYEHFQANIHSIQRVATVNIREENGQLTIGCDVQTYRISRPEPLRVHQMRAFSIFAREKTDITRIRHAQRTVPVRWTELGPDPDLQTLILQRIDTKLRTQTEGSI